MSITIQLKGGMGNQMFQYAIGRAQALRLGVDLKLDTQYYENREGNDWYMPYSLDQWVGVCAERTTQPEGRVIDRDEVHYDPDLDKEVTDGCHLKGYWQSEKYFSNISSILRDEFVPWRTPSTIELANSIKAEGDRSVSISIRRSNYTLLGVDLPMSYYLAGVERIVASVPDAHFFIFSDDGAWVKENLKLPYPTTVSRSHVYDQKKGTGCEAQDVWLMSLCKHAIVANSTFSWWGAWLNPNKGTVICPKIWNIQAAPLESWETL